MQSLFGVIDSLAQLVEHSTFNAGVLGSSPKRITGYKMEAGCQKPTSILFLKTKDQVKHI